MIYVACKIEEVTDFSTILPSSIKEGNYSLSVHLEFFFEKKETMDMEYIG